MKHFILMCDIIGSSKQSQAVLMEQFKVCTNHINHRYGSEIISPLTITLGDEFQGILENLATSIKVIVALEEFIIENNFQFKLRYVLLYGAIETNINNNIAFEMLGSGLTKARKTLEQLKTRGERFYIDVEDLPINTILNNAFNLYRNIIDGWKIDRDHQIISSFIKNYDYKIVSEELNRNRSLIWKREKTLNISSYFSIKEILNTITTLADEYKPKNSTDRSN